MEISFTQEVTYSTELSDRQVRELAAEMGLDVPTLRDLVGSGELLEDSDRKDHVIDWICRLDEGQCQVEDKEDPDNVAIND